MRYLGTSLTLVAGLIALPAGSQETGGIIASFEFLQRVESVRNPDLDPGQADTEIISTSNFAYTLESRTRQSDLSLRLHTALRAPLAGSNDDTDFDNSGAILRYTHRAPGARIYVYGLLNHRELAYLRSFDLVDENTIIDDTGDLGGTGTRTNARLRLDAQFRENQRFGWGFNFGTATVHYKNLSAGSSLRDVDSYNAAVNTRFDLNPKVQLTSRFSYSQSEQEGSAQTRTQGADFGLTVQRPIGELRSALSFAWPNQSADRVSWTVGAARDLKQGGRISFDIGGSFADGRDTAVVGRFDYLHQLSKVSQVSMNLNRQVSDGSDGSVVLRTTGRLGYGLALSDLTSLNFDVNYLNRDTLNSTDELTEYGVSLSVSHQLTREWNLNAGVSRTERDEFGSARATSDAVFFSLQRAWDAKF